VLVCHSRRETFSALAGLLPALRKEGVRPVTVPELLAESALSEGPAGEE
jgi:hypothetical protein